MLKSKIRKKILKIRKDKFHKNKEIKFHKLYKLMSKMANLKKIIVGGYYPVNYEFNDLHFLNYLEKKKN